MNEIHYDEIYDLHAARLESASLPQTNSWKQTAITTGVTTVLYAGTSIAYYAITSNAAISSSDVISYFALPAIMGAFSGMLADRYAATNESFDMKKRACAALSLSIGPFVLGQVVLIPLRSIVSDPAPHILSCTLGATIPFAFFANKKLDVAPDASFDSDDDEDEAYIMPNDLPLEMIDDKTPHLDEI
jgi:hypothetical protein